MCNLPLWYCICRGGTSLQPRRMPPLPLPQRHSAIKSADPIAASGGWHGRSGHEQGISGLDREDGQPPAGPGFPVLLPDPRPDGGFADMRLGRRGGAAPDAADRTGHGAGDRIRQPVLAREYPAPVGGHAGDVHALPSARLCAGGDARRRRGRTLRPVFQRDPGGGTRGAEIPADTDGGAGGHAVKPCRRCRLCGDDPAGGHPVRCGRAPSAGRDRRRLCGRFGRIFGEHLAGPA